MSIKMITSFKSITERLNDVDSLNLSNRLTKNEWEENERKMNWLKFNNLPVSPIIIPFALQGT
jgi:hypothetical protein